MHSCECLVIKCRIIPIVTNKSNNEIGTTRTFRFSNHFFPQFQFYVFILVGFYHFVPIKPDLLHHLKKDFAIQSIYILFKMKVLSRVKI